eukprot:3286331-Prymnesium_polylepis.1
MASWRDSEWLGARARVARQRARPRRNGVRMRPRNSKVLEIIHRLHREAWAGESKKPIPPLTP